MSMKERFIQLALRCNALQFGTFTLKSGRQSPYFFNAGLFYDGPTLKEIGECYAQLLLDHQIPCQQLFGPAYKGLPLATATAIALSDQGVSTTVTFNRKEAKDHGEGGVLIGAPLKGDIVVIDDVITAGTAFRQAEQLIINYGARVSAVAVALDRCECGTGHQSTLDEIKAQGVTVLSIITVYDLINYLDDQRQADKAQTLRDYEDGQAL
ncbi:MAG: orotate phosphoribosyltransferase [Gammaproteobacteria bacterium]|nr:orotate phosphoribosyltransferase [Gammaproteobacteria bacterium]